MVCMLRVVVDVLGDGAGTDPFVLVNTGFGERAI